MENTSKVHGKERKAEQEDGKNLMENDGQNGLGAIAYIGPCAY